MGQAISRRRSYTPGRTKNTGVAFPSAPNSEASTNGNVEILKDDDQLPCSPVSKTHTPVTSPSLSTPVGKTERRKRFMVGFPLRRTPSGRWSRRRRSTPHNGVRHPVVVTSPLNGDGQTVLEETSDMGNTSNVTPDETKEGSLTPSIKTNKKESSMKFLGRRKNKEKRNSKKGKKKKGRDSNLKHEGKADGMKEIVENVEGQLSGDVLKEMKSDTVTSFLPPAQEEDTGESTGNSLVVAEAYICNLPKISRAETDQVTVEPSHVWSEPSDMKSESKEIISELNVVASDSKAKSQKENQNISQTGNLVEKLSATEWNCESEPEMADLFYRREIIPQGRQQDGPNTLTYDSIPKKFESGNMAVEMDHEINQMFSSMGFAGVELEKENLFPPTDSSFGHSTNQNVDDSCERREVFDNDEAEYGSSLLNHDRVSTGSVSDESIKVKYQMGKQELTDSHPTALTILSDNNNTVESSQTPHFLSEIDYFEGRDDRYSSFLTNFESGESLQEYASNHQFTRSKDIEDTDNSFKFYALRELVLKKSESECEIEGVPEELSDYSMFPESSDVSLMIGRMSDVSLTCGQLTDMSILINQVTDSSQESISKEEIEYKKEDTNNQTSCPQNKIFNGLFQGKTEENVFINDEFPWVVADSSLKESHRQPGCEMTNINVTTSINADTESYIEEYVQYNIIDKAFENIYLSKEYGQLLIPKDDNAGHKMDKNLPKDPEAVHLEETTYKTGETSEISNDVVDYLDGLFLSKAESSIHYVKTHKKLNEKDDDDDEDKTQISNRRGGDEPLTILTQVDHPQLSSTQEVKSIHQDASCEVHHAVSSVDDTTLSRDDGDVLFEEDRFLRRVSDVVSPEDRYVSFTDVSILSSRSSSNPTSPLSVSMTELNTSPKDRDSRDGSHHLKKITLGPRLRTAILRKGSSGASKATPETKTILLTRPISVDFTDLETQGRITKVTCMDFKSPNAYGKLNDIASAAARTSLDACNNPHNALKEAKTEEASMYQEFSSMLSPERIHLVMKKERIAPVLDIQTNTVPRSECAGILDTSSDMVTAKIVQIRETVNVIEEDTLLPKHNPTECCRDEGKDNVWRASTVYSGKPAQTSVGENTDDREEYTNDSHEISTGGSTEINNLTYTSKVDLINEASKLISFDESKSDNISSEVGKVEFVNIYSAIDKVEFFNLTSAVNNIDLVNSSDIVPANQVESVNIPPSVKSGIALPSVDPSEHPLAAMTSVTELHSSNSNLNDQFITEERLFSDAEKSRPTPLFFTYESKLEVQLEKKCDLDPEMKEKCRIRVFSRDSQSSYDKALNLSPPLINATQSGHTSTPITASDDEHHNDNEEVFNSGTRGDLQSNKSNALAKLTTDCPANDSEPIISSESLTAGFTFSESNASFSNSNIVLKGSGENGWDTKQHLDFGEEVSAAELPSISSTGPEQNTHLCDVDSIGVVTVHQSAQNKKQTFTDDHACRSDISNDSENSQQHCAMGTVTDYPIGLLAAPESNKIDQSQQKECLNGDESPSREIGSFSKPEVTNLVRHVAQTTDINSNCRHDNSDRHHSKEDHSWTEFHVNSNKERYLDSNNGNINKNLNGVYSNNNNNNESNGHCIFPDRDKDNTDSTLITEETVAKLTQLLHCGNGTEHFENNNHVNGIDSAMECTTHL